jgi:ubiquinone/menaquinone biosynthesis C-methylase UbiE
MMQMKLYLPEESLLRKTSDVDYFNWNYTFPLKYLQRQRFTTILQLMGQVRYHRILEIGTGSGIFLPELSRHCDELYAFDVHDNMAVVQRLNRKMELGAMIYRGRAEAMPFRSDFFDLIVGVSVLEFVDDLAKAVFELKRVLKPDGIFVTMRPTQSKILYTILNMVAGRELSNSFKHSHISVSRKLESNFHVRRKRFFPPLFGLLYPVYRFYKLSKIPDAVAINNLGD